MPQIVRLPNGETVQFPDGMTPEQIQAVLDERFASAAPQPQPRSPGEEFAEQIPQGILEAVVSTAEAIRRGTPERFRMADVMGIPSIGGQGRAALEATGTLREPQGAAGQAGRMVGQAVPAFAVPGAAFSTMPRAALAGAGIGAATSGGELEGTVAGAIGGPVGHMVGRLAARAVQPVRSMVDPALEKTMQAAERLGFRRTPGQATGSRGLQRVETSLSSLPGGAGHFDDLAMHNQDLANRVAAKAIGLDDSVGVLVPERMGEAARNIGGKFDSAVANQRIPIEGDDLQRMLDAVEAVESLALPDDAERVRKLVTAFIDKLDSDASMSGATYQATRSDLAQLGRRALGGKEKNDEFGRAMNALVDVLDDAAERALPDANAELLREARRQWRYLVQLERPGVLKEDGNLSGLTLANNLRREDTGFRRGQTDNDLELAARFFQANRPMVGTSGTAERSALMAPFILGGGGAIGGAASADNPGQAIQRGLLGAAGGAAAPALMAKGAATGIMNPLSQAILRSRMLSDSARQRLLQMFVIGGGMGGQEVFGEGGA